MPMKVRKAVFPAAGLGTRFLPATKAQPKEMLPLVDKPIIQYGVEEAMASGCDQIIIITGRGKQAIEDHFDVSYELERMLEDRKKTDPRVNSAPAHKPNSAALQVPLADEQPSQRLPHRRSEPDCARE